MRDERLLYVLVSLLQGGRELGVYYAAIIVMDLRRPPINVDIVYRILV